MEDYLVRILAREAGLRGLACVTTNVVNEVCRRHGAMPTAAAALGRALTGAALVGALLKVQQRVSLKFEGNGPLRHTIVESDSYGRLRGFVANPGASLLRKGDDYDVVNAIGRAGLLTVVRDLRTKELQEGVVPLAASDVEGDLTYFLNQSDQIPSLVQIGVKAAEDGTVTVAGGVLVQAIPPYEEEMIGQMAEQVQELPPVEALLNGDHTPEKILDLIFAGVPYVTLEERPLRFECSCSWERTAQALRNLDRAEIEQMIEEEGKAEVDCNFCRAHYEFDAADLRGILETM